MNVLVFFYLASNSSFLAEDNKKSCLFQFKPKTSSQWFAKYLAMYGDNNMLNAHYLFYIH